MMRLWCSMLSENKQIMNQSSFALIIGAIFKIRSDRISTFLSTTVHRDLFSLQELSSKEFQVQQLIKLWGLMEKWNRFRRLSYQENTFAARNPHRSRKEKLVSPPSSMWGFLLFFKLIFPWQQGEVQTFKVFEVEDILLVHDWIV